MESFCPFGVNLKEENRKVKIWKKYNGLEMPRFYQTCLKTKGLKAKGPFR